jgi:DNA-directed RNA polymerase specialized sigma24 family protein
VFPVDTLLDADAELVAHAQAGKLEAFEELVRRHTQLICRTLMAILGNPIDAQDALQDALLSAFKHMSGFQGRSRFSTWLVRIARNTAFNDWEAGKTLRAWIRLNMRKIGNFAPRQVRLGRTTQNNSIPNLKFADRWKGGPGAPRELPRRGDAPGCPTAFDG